MFLSELPVCGVPPSLPPLYPPVIIQGSDVTLGITNKHHKSQCVNLNLMIRQMKSLFIMSLTAISNSQALASSKQAKIEFINQLVGVKDLPLPRYVLLDDLYGSGDFDEAKTLSEDIDRHVAHSLESLARLFRREDSFIREGLKNSYSVS